MKPYEYTESDGEKLRIEPGPNGGARVASYGASRIVEVEPSAVPAAALALYEAAGLPVPVILPRPEHTGGIEYAGGNDRYAYTSRVGSKVAIGWRGIEPAEFDPDEALEFAAHIAVNALAVKRGEPDPSEVEELATAIHRANCEVGDRCIRTPDDSDRIAARAVLLGGWKRETQP